MKTHLLYPFLKAFRKFQEPFPLKTIHYRNPVCFDKEKVRNFDGRWDIGVQKNKRGERVLGRLRNYAN